MGPESLLCIRAALAFCTAVVLVAHTGLVSLRSAPSLAALGAVAADQHPPLDELSRRVVANMRSTIVVLPQLGRRRRTQKEQTMVVYPSWTYPQASSRSTDTFSP